MSEALLGLIVIISALLVIYQNVGYPLFLRWYAKDIPRPKPTRSSEVTKFRLAINHCLA